MIEKFDFLFCAETFDPSAIMLALEIASLSAFQAAFPRVSLSGCYFYLGQNIHRKLQVIRGP